MPCDDLRGSGAVTLFGEVLVDELPDGDVVGGAPLNVASHLKRFGLDPVLITRVGDGDEAGARVLRAMEAAGLDDRGVQRDPAHPTGRVRVAPAEDGHRFEVLPNQAYDFVDADAAAAALRGLQARLTYFGTLAQRRPESRRALDAVLAVAGGVRWLDVNLRDPWFDDETIERSLAAADVVKLNDGELAAVSARLGLAGGTGVRHAADLAARYGLRSVVVTRGERGAWDVTAEGVRAEIAGGALGGPLADTVGAGDGFSAICILGLLRSWTPRETLARADAFARALCLVRGAIPRDPTFYAPFLEAFAAGD